MCVVLRRFSFLLPSRFFALYLLRRPKCFPPNFSWRARVDENDEKECFAQMLRGRRSLKLEETVCSRRLLSGSFRLYFIFSPGNRRVYRSNPDDTQLRGSLAFLYIQNSTVFPPEYRNLFILTKRTDVVTQLSFGCWVHLLAHHRFIKPQFSFVFTSPPSFLPFIVYIFIITEYIRYQFRDPSLKRMYILAACGGMCCPFPLCW